MNTSKLKDFEKKLIEIGDRICSWRDSAEAREVMEPIAFKTKADLKAHHLLSDLITQFFPGVVILSEEDCKQIEERPACYWLLDPIDGTASWFGGFDGFVTQVAYIENDVPVYGAIYAPVLQKLWTAVKNKGAWLNHIRLPVLAKTNRLNLIDNYPTPQRISEKIFNVMPVSRYIECGSLGLKSCMVADGTADLFVKDVVIRDWDIAPITVLIHEVGGFIRDLKGMPIAFVGSFDNNNGLIVARDENLLETVISMTTNA